MRMPFYPSISWFSPWRWRRRYFGIVTLLFACILCGGWIRSRFQSDALVILVGKTWIFNVVSERGYLGARAAGYGTDGEQGILWTTNPVDYSQAYDPMELVSVPYRVDLPGFHLGSHGPSKFPKGYFGLCFISYLTLTLILFVTAIWLLISKPRIQQHE